MDLTVGPNFFFWPVETVRGFYTELAAAPVSRVVIGETVCSKRLPFWQGEIPGAVETLLTAGKEVAITSLALITLKRERKLLTMRQRELTNFERNREPATEEKKAAAAP